jgi:hypothetical protein
MTKPLRLERRHFQFIQGVIAGLDRPEEKLNVAKRFAYALRDTNPNFKTDTFLKSCGIKD